MPDKKEVTLDEVAKRLDELSGKVRRMSDNWKKFVERFVGAAEASDGKLKDAGRASVGGFVLAFLIGTALIASAAYIFQLDPGGTSLFSVDDSGNVVAAGTVQGTTITATTGFAGAINGTVGATTAAAGSFTTLTSTRDVVTPTALTVTNGMVIPATVSVYNLTAASCMTNTIANASVKGQYLELCLLVGGTNTVTFADSGNLKLVAAAVLTDDDTLGLRSYDGTNWFQIFKNAN